MQMTSTAAPPQRCPRDAMGQWGYASCACVRSRSSALWGGWEHSVTSAFSKLAHGIFVRSGAIGARNVQRLPCRFLPYQPPFGRLETTRAVRLIRLLRAFRVVPAGQFIPPNFQPAAVVHVLSSLPYSEAAYSYSRSTGVPLVLIVHDDPEDFNRSYAWAGSAIRRQVRRIYRHATSRLCVSPELERTLQERYGAGVM